MHRISFLTSSSSISDPILSVLEGNLIDYCRIVVKSALNRERLFLVQETLQFTAERYAQKLRGMVETEAKSLIDKDIVNIKAVLEKINSPS